MSTKTYKARVRLPNGAYEDVTVQASNPGNARSMLEQQYGKGSIVSGPFQA
jgi:hypothetical protein